MRVLPIQRINKSVLKESGKEARLACPERNEKGKQARLYFIECERKAKAAPPAPDLNNPASLRAALLDYTERCRSCKPPSPSRHRRWRASSASRTATAH